MEINRSVLLYNVHKRGVIPALKGAHAWEFRLRVSYSIEAYLGGRLTDWKKK